MNRSRLLPLVILGVVVLSGCLAGGGNVPTTVGPDNNEPETGGPFGEPPTQNPWATDNITVSIVSSSTQDRNYAPLVQQSLTYWNQNMSDLGWEGQFIYVADTENPDVPVRIVDDVTAVGDETQGDEIGRAPVYNRTGMATDATMTDVQLKANLNDTSTVRVSIHEFGHTLGLQHDDTDEWPVMNATTAAATVAQPNATDRDNPWETDRLQIYYNDTTTASGTIENDYVVGELDEVLAFFSNGADGAVPQEVELVRTTDPASADIEFRIVETIDGGVSRPRWYGYDPDADGAFETYARGTITIQEDVNQDHMAWHSGAGLYRLFGHTSDSELPKAFTTRSRSADARQSWPS